MSARPLVDDRDVGEIRGTDGHGGGVRSGTAYILAEIDPDTLPERDVWDEVARRAEAYRNDHRGWRTGELEADLSQFTDSGGAEE